MSSVNNNANAGLHGHIPKKYNGVQEEIDQFLKVIADAHQEIMTFRTSFTEKLNDKDNFYDNVGRSQGDMGTNSVDDEEKDKTYYLSNNQLADVKKGIDNVRTSFREKVLGRLPG